MTAQEPLERIARCSPRVQRAHRLLRGALRSIRDRSLRQKVALTLGTLDRRQGSSLFAGEATLRRRFPELCGRLMATLPYHPRWTAPGASPLSHHPYPGGWLMHNATNVRTLQSLIATATTLRGLEIEADPLLAGMLLHDWAKPRMFYWKGERMEVHQGELGHHVAALAEMALRGFPQEVLIALAGVHAGWWEKPDTVHSFLEATAQALDRPELATLGKAQAARWSASGWIARQGEATWYRATREAAASTREPLRVWLATQAKSESVDLLEWMVWGWAEELALAHAYATEGAQGLAKQAGQALCQARAALSGS